MKNLLAFLSYRLRQRLVLLTWLTFLLGLFLAAIPGLLGCPSWWWLRWTLLLEPAWLVYDLFSFNTEFYPWLLHLFFVLVWLTVLGWLAQVVVVIREGGEFYVPTDRPTPLKEGEELPPVERRLPWGRLLLPPLLGGLLLALIATDGPLLFSFTLHRQAFDELAREALAEGGPGQRYEAPRWVGIYPIQYVGVNRQQGAVFTETGFEHAHSRGVYGGFIYKGTPSSGEKTDSACRIDDDWQAYRRGGGRAGITSDLP